MATIVAHHATPKPLALLSITGIPTFRHPFFNSSTLIPPDPIKEEEVEKFLVEPVSVGGSPPNVFDTGMLLPNGDKNENFLAPAKPPSEQDPNRGMLYDYFLYNNTYVSLVGSVDAGFDWAQDAAQSAKLAEWPPTILIQGDDDDDVAMDVCASVADKLGDKGKLFLAEDLGHLFEASSFIDDNAPGMHIVRRAVDELDQIVSAALDNPA